jgi:hypothetical protein
MLGRAKPSTGPPVGGAPSSNTAPPARLALPLTAAIVVTLFAALVAVSVALRAGEEKPTRRTPAELGSAPAAAEGPRPEAEIDVSDSRSEPTPSADTTR